jgi:hypothetical protein
LEIYLWVWPIWSTALLYAAQLWDLQKWHT